VKTKRDLERGVEHEFDLGFMGSALHLKNIS